MLSGVMFSALSLIDGSVGAETQITKNAIAKAEAALDKVKAAWAPDLKSFCSTVTPGEGRLLLCMTAHEDKMSDGCYDALLAFSEGVDLAISNVQRAASACVADN